MYVPFRSAALRVRGIETQGVDVYRLRTGHIPLVWCGVVKGTGLEPGEEMGRMAVIQTPSVHYSS